MSILGAIIPIPIPMPIYNNGNCSEWSQNDTKIIISIYIVLFLVFIFAVMYEKLINKTSINDILVIDFNCKSAFVEIYVLLFYVTMFATIIGLSVYGVYSLF